MAKYLKLFETHSEYVDFTHTEDFLLPNVSYCKDVTDEVHYNPLPTPQPSNILLYEAPAKLTETTSDKGNGLHTNKFNGPTIISHDFDNGVGTVELSGDLIALPEYTFYGASTITKVSMPNGVTNIGQYAFYSCNGLTSVGVSGSGASVELPDSLTTIYNYAFYNCSGLTTVTIPSTVTTINDSAFYTCTHLTSITVLATTPPTIGSNQVFANTNNCPIYVPSESVDTYKAAYGWSSYASRIQAIP